MSNHSHVVIVGSHPAAPDHIHTRLYNHGEVYVVGSHYMPEHLASALLAEKWALPTTAPKVLPQAPGADHTALADAREAELEAQNVHAHHEHGLVGHQHIEVEPAPSRLPAPSLTQGEHDKLAASHHHPVERTGPKEVKGEK